MFIGFALYVVLRVKHLAQIFFITTVQIVAQTCEVGMNDLINRQNAIDAMFNLSDKLANEMLFIDAIVDEIENLPIAKQKKGKWQRRKGSDCWECSECHAVLEDFDISNHNYYYCYHCGTNMTDDYGFINIEKKQNEDT
jgi:hypothetical protein